ncbi:DHA2 family efflux MFS transporter permease subunit [Georgenia halophila]|uniref:DHA2 family efflux MFS transporter permease subunit n=1 Tax=Georgenia halophila TaxID=620889 RepID=A0ABP8LPL0_9MICO
MDTTTRHDRSPTKARGAVAPGAAAPGAPGGTDAATSDKLPREHVVVIGLLLASAFVVILNETTMAVALNPIMDDLDITASTGQWLTTAFMLTMAVVIPTTGFVLQRLGTRTTFIIAMSLFSTGTLLASLSPGFAFLLAGRVVQATGTAIMMPLLMTTVMTIVPASRRGRVMGNVGLVISAAPALGPTFSGALIEQLGWRGVFTAVLPIALVALIVGTILVRDVSAGARVHLDPISPVLAAFGFGGLVYGLSSLGESAGHEPLMPPWIPLLVGVVFLAAFVLRQRHLQGGSRVLMDMRVFAARQFRIALAVLVTCMISLFGVIILLPLLLQDSVGMSPLASGLVVLPGGLIMGLLGPVVGRLYDRVGPRPLALPGMGIAAVAFVMLSFVGPGMSWGLALGGHMILSVGLALMFTPLMTTALGALEPPLYSHGSAMVTTIQQLAAASGTAAAVAVMTIRSASLAEDGADPATALAGGTSMTFLLGAALLVLCSLLAVRLRQPAPTFGPGHGQAS